MQVQHKLFYNFCLSADFAATQGTFLWCWKHFLKALVYMHTVQSFR